MPPNAVEMLEQLIRPSDRGLEFGSGRSTRWLATRTAHLTSVEENSDWANSVRTETADLENVDLRFATGDDYVDVAGEFADRSLDFCLVDGALRDRCAMRAVPKIAPAGILVIDDVHRYLPHPSVASLPVATLRPATPVWADVWETIGIWRSLWLNDGFTATAIFFRP
jgi:predicted O-methyltransferase YrrM